MNNYFCVLPFFSVETSIENTDKNIYCCRLSPGSDINKVRNDIKDKKRSKSCSTCWALEDAGLLSERQIHNRTLDFLLDLSLENIEKKSLSDGFNPLQIKLTTSNLCNGQCITCNPKSSSSWAMLEGNPTKYAKINHDLLDFGINWSNIVSLSFVGGEPLLEKQNFKILQNLIDLNNTNCFISIVTNGSISLTNKQFEILEQFPNLNICLSIDGTFKSFEYLRYPLKWDKLLENLKMFKSITKNISVSCMISNCNIYFYSDLINFFREQNLNYLMKQIINPFIFNPSNLKQKAKDIILEKNKEHQNEIHGFLYMNKFNEKLYESFLLELERQDNLKKIRLKDYCPELINLL